jgi:hypothetical protein
MQPSRTLGSTQSGFDPLLEDGDHSSAISWSAILGGSFVTLALMFIFFILGTGLGYATGASHDKSLEITSKVIIWLVVSQWFASGVGAYLTGRLRTKWRGVHTHEVSFRDTAHGLITWAVATIFYTAIVLLAAATNSNMSSSVFDTASPASVSLYTALSMFVGAFVACIAAALGGIQRDEIHPVL